MNTETGTTKKPPEMVTIRECAARGVLPEWCLRRLVAQKKIPVVKSGRTQYINYDRLIADLENGTGKLWDTAR